MTTETDTKPVLTYDQALADLKALVAEFGEDYVYQKPEGRADCSYVAGNQPGCIVGHVLNRHGVTVERLAELDLGGPVSGAADVIGLVRDDAFPFVLDHKTIMLLCTAQDHQDGGKPWGKAVARAEADTQAA